MSEHFAFFASGIVGMGKVKNGRGGKIRTCDPLFPKQVRYQAALRPDDFYAFYRIPTKVQASFAGFMYFLLRTKKAMLDEITRLDTQFPRTTTD